MDPVTPNADVSVRVAWADDAVAIAEVQRRAWRASYADLLPDELLAALSPTEGEDPVAMAWRESVVRPTEARQRVLVALERATLRGFAVCAPATDPDADPVQVGEIADLTVDPDHLGEGHGSRLMQACVDTLRADRFLRAVTWVRSSDDVLREFLAGAGWAPDGAHRTLDLRGDDVVTVKQVRLHTTL